MKAVDLNPTRNGVEKEKKVELLGWNILEMRSDGTKSSRKEVLLLLTPLAQILLVDTDGVDLEDSPSRLVAQVL